MLHGPLVDICCNFCCDHLVCRVKVITMLDYQSELYCIKYWEILTSKSFSFNCPGGP